MKNTSSNNMTFGKRLAYTRKRKKLSRKQLANLVGLCEDSISRFETGNRNPSAAMIQKIATALVVPEDWFENDDNFNTDTAENQRLIDANNRRAFGQRLAYSRIKKELTKKQLANLAGVCPDSIRLLETGNRNPSAAMIQKIATALEVPEDWFENENNFKTAENQCLIDANNCRDFGQRLAFTRKKKGLPQKELAKLSGVPYTSIMHYEQGRNTPCSVRLRKIIKALEVSDDWFENDDNFKEDPIKKLTDFGQHLAYTRKKKGISQRQLAELIGTHRMKICNLEAGIQHPDELILNQIIKTLGLSDDWFENDDNFKEDLEPIKKLTDFGQRLAYTRKKKGLKQSQLAELVGMSWPMIGFYERGFGYPSMPVFSKIIKALEVPDDWFENAENFKDDDIKPVIRLTKEQQQFVAEHEWLIRYMFYKYFNYPKNEELYENYYGCAAISLCEVAMIYDENKGSFPTFAKMRIQSSMARAFKNEKKNIQPCTSLDKLLGDDPNCDDLASIIPDPEDKFESLEYKILVESVCQKVAPVLTDNEKEVFRLWLHGVSIDETAAIVGISTSTVTRSKREVITKCRTLFTPDDIFS